MRQGLRWFTTVAVIIIFLLFALIRGGAQLYTDWLWFNSLNYQQVFFTIILSEIGLRIAVGVAFFVLLFVNLFITSRPVLQTIAANKRIQEDEDVITIHRNPVSQFISKRLYLAACAVVSLAMAFFVSLSVTDNWVILQNFLHPTSFGLTDPIFNKDVGDFVFKLPLYQSLYRLMSWSLLIIAFWVAAAYFLAESTKGVVNSIFRSIAARYHISALAAVYFIIRAWGYRLEQYSLLYSERGVVFGPGYTDVHANLLAYKIMFFIALVCAAVILINIFMRRFKLVLYSVGFLFVASIALGGIYPAVVQKFLVVPNELNREKPYILNGIKYTRLAYDLDKVERKSFPAGRTVSADDIKDNEDTIKNIRLWDYRPLQQTYSQLQEMRPYYELKNIDVDRYMVNGQYRQLMVAARELNQNQLPDTAKTWVNQRLKYTHGYGAVLSPVNEVTGEGLPQLFVKDIPPVTQTDLKIERPEIYFGESTDNYVIVNTHAPEFDYPKGDDNASTQYKDKSGVKIGSLFQRLMFAISLGDYKLLLSSDITKDSQVLYYRSLRERVPKIAPFLRYDSDPYVVLSEGKLYWLWDAYTTTSMFPYSEPFSARLNYIRNSVKVVVDAYNGKVTFFAADAQDPLLKTYSRIFPGLFRPLDEMPADLKQHIRYPEDLFMIQSQKYAMYHMENPEVFYNREDKWNLPTELFGNEEQQMQPYYTIVRLPGEKEPEFIQIMPFTPQNKKNMIAWLAGRSDGEHYGKLLVYEFPKQELVYGPMQVEARINQDTTISQQISLWDQRGSSVIRGNLLVIPVKDSLLYVEPLYLQAQQSRMPELRRVIVAHGDQVVMEPTLEQALQRIFGAAGERDTAQPTPRPGQQTDKELPVGELAREANRIFNESQNRLKAGDWAGYGEALKQLKSTLQELSERTS